MSWAGTIVCSQKAWAYSLGVGNGARISRTFWFLILGASRVRNTLNERAGRISARLLTRFAACRPTPDGHGRIDRPITATRSITDTPSGRVMICQRRWGRETARDGWPHLPRTSARRRPDVRSRRTDDAASGL